jgi:hypothetical protein
VNPVGKVVEVENLEKIVLTVCGSPSQSASKFVLNRGRPLLD